MKTIKFERVREWHCCAVCCSGTDFDPNKTCSSHTHTETHTHSQKQFSLFSLSAIVLLVYLIDTGGFEPMFPTIRSQCMCEMLQITMPLYWTDRFIYSYSKVLYIRIYFVGSFTERQQQQKTLQCMQFMMG